jgi:hypothetical protein
VIEWVHDNKDDATAASILKEAASIVEGSRQKTHGDKERSFQAIADLWMVYLGHRKDACGTYISSYDVAVMMILMKAVRSIQGSFIRDHSVDMAGYAAIAGEIALSKSGNADVAVNESLVSKNPFMAPKPIQDADSVSGTAYNPDIAHKDALLEVYRLLHEDAEYRLRKIGDYFKAEAEKAAARSDAFAAQARTQDQYFAQGASKSGAAHDRQDLRVRLLNLLHEKETGQSEAYVREAAERLDRADAILKSAEEIGGHTEQD